MAFLQRLSISQIYLFLFQDLLNYQAHPKFNRFFQKFNMGEFSYFLYEIDKFILFDFLF